MKRIIIIVGILFGITAFMGMGYTAMNTGLFQRDMIIEKDPNATKKTKVTINEEIKTKNIDITYSNEIADDGSLIFHVKNGSDFIGTFYYKPWLENRPVYRELNNGDIILGKHQVLRNNKIESLTDDLGIGVYDYDVAGSTIAFIGMKTDGSEEICIYTKDLTNKKTTLVDTFRYPEVQYHKANFLAWGNNGLLYYDYTLNGKPVIKVFDSKEGRTSGYRTDGSNPQISPDGNYMVIYALDALDKNQRSLSESQLIDVQNNSKIAKLDGSRKIFWDRNYLFIQNIDESSIDVYLKDNGAKIKSLPFSDLPLEIKVSNEKVNIKGYKYENNNITLNEEIFSLTGTD